MKKLLYTLLLGLVITSCQKEETGGDIAPALTDVEVVTESDVDIIVSNILDNLSAFPLTKKGGASASKGSDYVALYVFISEGSTYVTLLDETNDDLCFGDITAAPVFLDNSNGDGSNIAVEDADGNVSVNIGGNFSVFFEGGNNSLIKLDSNLQAVGVAIFSDSNLAEFPQ